MPQINLNDIEYFFLTTDTNGKRKKHILEIFGDRKLNEVNPVMGIPREKSGATGFSRMIDMALRKQNNKLSFQPFVMLEDDVSKYRDFPEILTVPDDCDILYIGLSLCGLHKKDGWQPRVWTQKDQNNEDVVRIFNMLSTHGIIICTPLGALALQRAILEGYYTGVTWDVFFAAIQPFYKVYALKQPLVFQDGLYGGVEGKTKVSFNSGIEHSEVISGVFPENEKMDCVSTQTIRLV